MGRLCQRREIKMKKASDIIKYGVIKKYGIKKKYAFNSIDVETIDNEIFLLGYHLNDVYYYTLDNFFEILNMILIRSVQNNRDILTWSRYDNHHIFKLILNNVVRDDNEKIEILKKVGKITPLLGYNYNGFNITILNIIKDSIIIEVSYEKSRKRVNIYNLKNLFQSDLLTIARNYNLTYYSKLGEEFHIINKDRFFDDKEYQKMVLKSNELDSKVIIDIANKFIDSFIDLTGAIPKTIYTAGSIARSFLLSTPEIDPYKINFYHFYKDNPYYDKLLDYAMK